MASTRTWKVGTSSISLDQPVVMGILNVTTDSFAQSEPYLDVEAAVEAGLEMASDGAGIIDVGGESTRPGADAVPEVVEMARVLPVVERLAADGVAVSIDTSKPGVARAAIDSGAVIVNDVTGLQKSEMRRICAQSGVGVVIMHMKGTPKTMQVDPRYDDVVGEIQSYLAKRAEDAVVAGVAHGSIVLDPGIGFGKTFDQNMELMAHLDSFAASKYPLLIGTSRKGFLREVLAPLYGGTEPRDRDGATAATVALAVVAGVSILRVHNVRLAVEVAHTVKAMVPRENEEEIHRT